MALKTRDELKALFQTGDQPSQQDFEDLIDSTASASGDEVVCMVEKAPVCSLQTKKQVRGITGG